MLTIDQIEDNKKLFLKLLTNTGRNTAPLQNYLTQESDFFTAPASTKYHEDYAGGLCQHSLRVADAIIPVYTIYECCYCVSVMPTSDIVFCALLHDICKTNFYKLGTRNVKNQETGEWEQKEYYTINDQFPMGHGEKSVMILQRYVRLSDEEIAGINWHMGSYDMRCKDWSGSTAYAAAAAKYPLVLALHTADSMATFWTAGD
jgi:hypothetical protein